MKIKIMKPWFSRLMRNYEAVTIYPFGVYVQPGKDTEETIRHEGIHWKQQKEMLCIPFYIWYNVEFLIKVFKYGWEEAYWNISFEREAYQNDTSKTYLQTRKPFTWFRYIIK